MLVNTQKALHLRSPELVNFFYVNLIQKINCNYSAPTGLIIIAWATPQALKGHIKILNRTWRACSLLFW
ncbi:MAG: hypothetical protein DRR19_07100 [Candidatus Parabeggiatoa sp. nov. 1]|nr:MAG: hypothetical protein DRR19_07100 [Gammaproteobacteria bacterium]